MTRSVRFSSLVGGVLLLAACDVGADGSGAGGTGSGGGSVEVVPVFSRKAIIMAVGDPSPDGTPTAAEWQDPLDGWSYVFFVGDDAAITYECQHDAVGTNEKREELRIPIATPCVVPISDGGGGGTAASTGGFGGFGAGGFGASTGGFGGFGAGGFGAGGGAEGGGGSSGGYSGPPGENPTPTGYKQWFGASGGACGTWAVAMCDRILGVRDPNTQVTETEWDQITVQINGTSGGTSDNQARLDYYAGHHYVATEERFDGTAEDYAKMAERKADGCDVKLLYARRMPDMTYENAHIETVTSVEGTTVHTNSWGNIAAVTGGAKGGFNHSREGNFGAPGTVWPAESTEVWVTYVCEGTIFDELGWLILGQ